MKITGKCHCGNLSFKLEWEGGQPDIPARACACSFCLKHGGIWTSNPRSTLEVTVRDPSLITKYQFGTKTAEFHVCSRCGVVPLVTSQIEGQTYPVVNVNTFENVEPSLLRRSIANVEGDEAESRLARRKRNWIADVPVLPPGLTLPSRGYTTAGHDCSLRLHQWRRRVPSRQTLESNGNSKGEHNANDSMGDRLWLQPASFVLRSSRAIP